MFPIIFSWFGRLVKDGYQIFMIDFRGYGKSTGTPTHLNIASDGQFVFDYLLQRQDVRKTKVIILNSYKLLMKQS